MQSKISLRQSLFIVSSGGIALFSIMFFLTMYLPARDSYMKSASTKLVSTKSASTKPSSTKLASASVASIRSVAPKEQAGSGLPIRLKIPRINVDTALEYVGITPVGALDVPKGPTNAAWFDLGTRPGERGSSVIDGHFGWKDGIPAVFDKLYQLHPGDKVYVEDEKGATITFVVREVRTYGESEDASGVFVSNDAQAHLNLITCEGVWNKAQKSYSNRLVVFTDKEMK